MGGALFDGSQLFGISVAIGDVNGDGSQDLIIGAPHAFLGSGRVYVFHTSAGTELVPQQGNAINRNGQIDSDGQHFLTRSLGTQVSAADVNGDGIADVIASSELEHPGRRARVRLSYDRRSGASAGQQRRDQHRERQHGDHRRVGRGVRRLGLEVGDGTSSGALRSSRTGGRRFLSGHANEGLADGARLRRHHRVGADVACGGGGSASERIALVFHTFKCTCTPKAAMPSGCGLRSSRSAAGRHWSKGG